MRRLVTKITGHSKHTNPTLRQWVSKAMTLASPGPTGFLCLILTLAATVAFAVGLALPFVRLVHGERLDAVSGLFIWLLSNDETYTLFGSVAAIWNGSAVLGLIAFTFSLILPSVKMAILMYTATVLRRDLQRVQFFRRWVERIGPWSMLEVFLVALTLLLVKTLPFGTAIYLLPGFYFFCASVVLSLLAAMSLPESAPFPKTLISSAHASFAC